jgi:hypothetical protein
MNAPSSLSTDKMKKEVKNEDHKWRKRKW